MQVIENPSETTWREALTDPAATFFHTPEWSRLMREAFPRSVEVCPVGFRFSDDTVGVLPLIRLTRFRGLTRSFYSMFPGVYGGAICTRELTHDERLAINQWLAGQKGMRCVSLAPPGVPNSPPAGARKLARFTHRISLRKDLDVLRSDLLSEGKKRNVRKAEREGVRVFIGDSASHWKHYYEAYVSSLRRWPEPPAFKYPFRLFKAMAEDTSGGIALWVAAVGDDIAGGAVVLSFGKYAIYWHGASFERFHHLRVNDYLHVKITEDTARRGFPFYDLSPSGGHRGVEEFKASLGAEKVPLEAWIREPAWVKAVSRMKAMLRSP